MKAPFWHRILAKRGGRNSNSCDIGVWHGCYQCESYTITYVVGRDTVQDGPAELYSGI